MEIKEETTSVFHCQYESSSQNEKEYKVTERLEEEDGHAVEETIVQSQMKLINLIPELASHTQLSIGPFQQEKVYQVLLAENLEVCSAAYKTRCETITALTVTDINGNLFTIDGGIYGRTDIEIRKERVILELKTSTSATKLEHLFQIKKYLDQKANFDVGILVNFISKETGAYVQIDVIYKTGEHKMIDKIRFNTYERLPTVNTECLETWVNFVKLPEVL
jgi:hypothetical protein|tara:strand:- start:326 stop:988 length:663 start_codon:yes stop_codon:yes gene_type:complete